MKSNVIAVLSKKKKKTAIEADLVSKSSKYSANQRQVRIKDSQPRTATASSVIRVKGGAVAAANTS